MYTPVTSHWSSAILTRNKHKLTVGSIYLISVSSSVTTSQDCFSSVMRAMADFMMAYNLPQCPRSVFGTPQSTVGMLVSVTLLYSTMLPLATRSLPHVSMRMGTTCRQKIEEEDDDVFVDKNRDLSYPAVMGILRTRFTCCLLRWCVTCFRGCRSAYHRRQMQTSVVSQCRRLL